MQGRCWAALGVSPAPQGHLGRRCSKRNGGGGIRPPHPSPLPQQPECGFGARCPGRPGRCATHVKHTHVQAGEVSAHVCQKPRAWAPAAPAGSQTRAQDPHGGVEQCLCSEPSMGANRSVCACVCVQDPDLMLAKGVLMGVCLGSQLDC